MVGRLGVYHFPHGLGVNLDISLRHCKRAVPSESLNIPETAAEATYVLGGTSDEGSSATVTGTADQAKIGIPDSEHVDDDLSRGGFRPGRLDNVVAAAFGGRSDLKRSQRRLEFAGHRYNAAAASLCGTIGEMNAFQQMPLGVCYHPPCD